MEFNLNDIRARGGRLSGDDDFVIVACTACGTQYLYNEETLLLYLDPSNLQRHVLNIEGECQPCRGCHLASWDFRELTAVDDEAISSGPWFWCIAR